jgi:hypothetical protein
MPGRPPRRPGLLADLQEARATTIHLMERYDNHVDILGVIAGEIKPPK